MPLSLTSMRGRPRSSTMRSSSRATRTPDSDVSTTRARHSRLKSSTTARMRNRLPSANASAKKSSDQRWLRFQGSSSGARVPSAPLAHREPFLAIDAVELL